MRTWEWWKQDDEQSVLLTTASGSVRIWLHGATLDEAQFIVDACNEKEQVDQGRRYMNDIRQRMARAEPLP